MANIYMVIHGLQYIEMSNSDPCLPSGDMASNKPQYFKENT